MSSHGLPGALPADALAIHAERLDGELSSDGTIAGDGFKVLFDTTLRGGFAVACDDGWDWLECRAWIRRTCGFDDVEQTPPFMKAAAEAREISKRHWAPGGWADRRFPRLPMTAWRVIDPDGNDGAVTEHREKAASRIAGKLLRTRAIEPQLASDLLHAWNQTWCRPPLPDDDIRGIFDAIAIREIERLEMADE